MFEISSCPTCGSQKLRRVRRDFEGEYQGDAYRVEGLEFFECPDCGEKIYSREAMRRIEAKSPAFVSRKVLEVPKFLSESDETDWWASPAGRAYVKQKSADGQRKRTKSAGSSLVAKLNRKPSLQIAIRLPETDIAQAREIADRKGIGYQTLLKMFVREGLSREARRR